MSSDYVATNKGSSTVATGFNSSATSFIVATGEGARFPSPTGGNYTLVVLQNTSGVREIVCVVGRASDTFTVGIPGSAAANVAGRNYESIYGMSAAAWVTGDVVSCRPTAAIATAAMNAVTLAGTQTLTNKTLTSPTITSPTLTSPALGTVASGVLTACTAATQSASDNSTKLASTAYADAAAAAQWTTGDVKLTLKTAADTGWILMNDGTMGNAASGGTTRANADTSDLFTLLWTNTADAQCAVSAGRGVSAAADYAANKTIALPKALGRALATYGAGSGLTSRALALALGDENLQSHTHTGTTGTESATHTHGVDRWQQGTGAGGGYFISPGTDTLQTGTQSANHTHTITTAATGAGAAENMQPTLFLNTMIKL